jgi:predicted nucleic acid-binding protein
VTRAVFEDTGPLYTAVDPDDQFHFRSHDELNQFQRDGTTILIPTSIVLECYTLVLRRLDIAVAHEWIDDLRQGPALVAPLVSDIQEAAILIQRFPDQPITLVDATLAVLARRGEAPVWTYDHHFDVMQIPVWR